MKECLNCKKEYNGRGKKFCSRQCMFSSDYIKEVRREQLKGNQFAKGKNWKLSEKTKKKMSLAQTGNKKWFGKKHTVESRKKMSANAKQGSEHYLWKGGVTKIGQAIRNSLAYKLWRESVFNRDNWTCLDCGVRSKKGISVILQAHHIKSFSEYPKLRFELSNGRTLCVECHKKTASYGRVKSPFISAKYTLTNA